MLLRYKPTPPRKTSPARSRIIYLDELSSSALAAAPAGLPPESRAEYALDRFEAAVRTQLLKTFFEHPTARKVIFAGAGFALAEAIARDEARRLGWRIAIEGRP